MSEYYLAVDIGASGGRHMLGTIRDGKLVLEEIYRFGNGMVNQDGKLLWDTGRLFREIINGMKRCKERNKIPVSMSIDTWAVDYVLLDEKDQILSIPYDKEKVLVCLESKVFGIGMESYTVGSSEFTINYAASRGILSLMDNGHYHPTEVVSDKISSMLLFFDQIALHVTRPVRWDSDHVVLFDNETKEIAKEIVRNHALERVKFGLDFFDASINRIAAWTIGMRNFQKALLYALLCPNEKLAALQEEGRFTEILMLQEEMKTIETQNFRDLAKEFHVTLPEKFL